MCGKKNEPNVDNVKKKDLFWVFLDIERKIRDNDNETSVSVSLKEKKEVIKNCSTESVFEVFFHIRDCIARSLSLFEYYLP